MKTTEDLARPFIAEDWTDHCPGYYRSMNLEGFAAAIRAQALEEAAQVCQGIELDARVRLQSHSQAGTAYICAAAIRALAGAPAT